MSIDLDSLYMVKSQFAGIGTPLTVPGYSLRKFRPGSTDASAWANIETAAGEFTDEKTAYARFSEWTQGNEKMLADRMFFLIDDSTNQPVGTVTAWVGDIEGEPMGRVHWLAIKPEHQGKKLARPLLSAALQELGNKYKTVYLKTHPKNLEAINLYTSMGFTPLIRSTAERDIWQQLRDRVKPKAPLPPTLRGF